MNNFMGHQGDVFFEVLSDDLKQAFLVKKDSLLKIQRGEEGYLTIVEGEATHHHHQFHDANVHAYEGSMFQNVKPIFVSIENGEQSANFTHFHVKEKKKTKEHSDVKLPSNVYLFRTQQQCDLTNVIFPVID